MFNCALSNNGRCISPPDNVADIFVYVYINTNMHRSKYEVIEC